MNKFLRLTLVSLSSIALVGCGGTTSGNTSAEGASTQTSAEVVDTPTLTGSYLSPAQLGYSNMRPTYNYYLTTFAFQNLETYSDNTYCLTLSSSTFSAVILPEEGNDATGNERNNSLVKYYGAFTSTVDDLDDDRAVRLFGFLGYLVFGPVFFKVCLVLFDLGFHKSYSKVMLCILLQQKMQSLADTCCFYSFHKICTTKK